MKQENQSIAFDRWMKRIESWKNSARLLERFTKVSLESSKEGNPENESSKRKNFELSSKTTDVRERLYRSGFMYKRILQLQALLARLDAECKL